MHSDPTDWKLDACLLFMLGSKKQKEEKKQTQMSEMRSFCGLKLTVLVRMSSTGGEPPAQTQTKAHTLSHWDDYRTGRVLFPFGGLGQQQQSNANKVIPFCKLGSLQLAGVVSQEVIRSQCSLSGERGEVRRRVTTPFVVCEGDAPSWPRVRPLVRTLRVSW